jgi:ABC-type nitrate/sulfonate/bicarbonate transport system substrate-binding protein
VARTATTSQKHLTKEGTMKCKRLLTAVVAPLLLAGTLAACGGGGDSGEAASSAATAVPTSESQVDGKIDTAKVKKSLVVGVDNPYYLFHEDVIIAQEKGYLKDVGIDNVKIVETEDPLPGLIGGSLDLVLYDTDTAIAAGVKSKAGITYLSPYLGGEANILGVRKGIDSAEDLKGKTITGGQFGSRNDFLIRKLLTDNGIDPDKDVKLVSTGGQSNERLQAVLAGTVDGASLQLRHKALLEAQGGKFLFQEVAQVPQVGWSATKLFKESPETVAAFLSATLKARAYIDDISHKEDVLSIMEKKKFDLPPDYRAAYAAENSPSYHTKDGGFEVADMDKFVKTQIDLKVIPPGTDWHDYVNPLPLWRAQKALGYPLRPSIEDFSS